MDSCIDKWQPIELIDFSRDGFYHIDTRDFCCVYYSENSGNLVLPDPSEEFTDYLRLKTSLVRLKANTGGDEDWRHLVLQSEGGGWLKYIRVRIQENKILLYTTFQNKFERELTISMLESEVEDKEFYYELKDGEPAEKSEPNKERKTPLRFGETREFKWKRDKNGAPYQEYNPEKW